MFYSKQFVALVCLALVVYLLFNLESGITQAQRGNPEAKLSHRLQLLTQSGVATQDVESQAQSLSLPASGPGSLLTNKNGDLLVYIRLTNISESSLQAVTNAGASIIYIAFEYNIVTAYVESDQLGAVAAVEAVANIREELTPWISGTQFPNQEKGQIFPAGPKAQSDCPSALTSEGDIQLNAIATRTTFGLDGNGITVGVLSDSYDNPLTVLPTDAAADIVSGDLPGPSNPCGRTSPVNLIKEGPPKGDEGRAMLQIIHDLAPGSDLAFASAFFGQFDFANQIHALQAAGVDIMVDDILYFTEPFFQDGPISVAIADVTAAGTLYFTSAGNSHNEDIEGNAIASYEAPAYRPVSCPIGLAFTGDCHDFDPTSSTDNDNGFMLEPNGRLTLDLQWAEPWNGVITDLDIYLLDESNTVLASSTDLNPDGTEIPVEFFSYINNSETVQSVRLVINRADGTDTPRLKYILIQSDGLISTEYNAANSTDIFGQTLFGHAGANEALSVAAIPYNNNDTPESFTAHGFPTYYFGPAVGTTPAGSLASPEIRQKPDITATDGNRNTFFGTFQAGFNRFFGTSAASPHAAAVAALLQQQATLQGNPLSQSTTETILETTAATIAFGSPEVTGAGLVDALEAIQVLVDSPPVNPTPTSIPTTVPQSNAIMLAINGPTSVEAGESFSVTVEAQDVAGLGLYGAQFDLNFDPLLVSAANLQVNPNLNFVVLSTIDNDIGRIRLVASRQGNVPGLVGEVTLLTFDITAAEASGAATFTFDNVIIGDPQAQAFDIISQTYTVSIGETPSPTPVSDTPTPEPTATAVPGTPTPTETPVAATPTPTTTAIPSNTPTATATPPTSTPAPSITPTNTAIPTSTPTPDTSTPEPTTAAIFGQVILAGRTGNVWSGAVVTINDSDQSATTDAAGSFSIPNVATGIHNSITANAPGYLSASCTTPTITAPETILNSITLLSGDMNGDDVVDITDATAIGLSFGDIGPDLPPNVDINLDQVIDILDIILVSANFGKVGPQMWLCQ